MNLCIIRDNLVRANRSAFAALFCMLLLFPCFARADDAVEIEHALGKASVPVNPTRVVAFDLSILDSMDAIGVQGVRYAMPKQAVPGYLKKFLADDVVDAGGMKDPNLERIYEFEPDVIFISPRQTDYYDKLSEIAPTVCISIDYRDFFAGFEKSMSILGKIFSLENAADRETKRILAKAEAVKAKADKTGKKGLVVMVNDGAISAYGPGSRFGIVHDTLGVQPADSGVRVSNHGQSVDFEYLARINPDILFVINRNVAIGVNGSKNGSPVLDNELVKRTNAGKNGKVITLDAAVWYLAGSGVESLDIMIDEIDKALD